MSAPNTIFIFDLMGPGANYPGGIKAEHLRDELQALGVNVILEDTSTRPKLFAFVERVLNVSEANTKIFPVLHFFGHGNNAGIAVEENSEGINWTLLCDILKPLYDVVKGNLVLCFDVCDGLHGFKIARKLLPLPFLALVGPITEIHGQASLKAFVEFYRASAIEITDLDQAVDRMNRASGYADERYQWVIGTKGSFDFTGRVKSIALVDDSTGDIVLS
jgi:hypothetical protein